METSRRDVENRAMYIPKKTPSVARKEISARSRMVASGSTLAICIINESRRDTEARCLHSVWNGVGVVKRHELNRDLGRFMVEGDGRNV